MNEPNAIDVFLDPKAHGYKVCPNCNGYGSSLTEVDINCTKCKDSTYKGLIKEEKDKQ